MAQEVAQSLKLLQTQLTEGIEHYMEAHPELIDRIFQCNEVANTTLENFDKITRYVLYLRGSFSFYSFILSFIISKFTSSLPPSLLIQIGVKRL
jgi:hypothetical protein